MTTKPPIKLSKFWFHQGEHRQFRQSSPSWKWNGLETCTCKSRRVPSDHSPQTSITPTHRPEGSRQPTDLKLIQHQRNQEPTIKYHTKSCRGNSKEKSLAKIKCSVKEAMHSILRLPIVRRTDWISEDTLDLSFKEPGNHPMDSTYYKYLRG